MLWQRTRRMVARVSSSAIHGRGKRGATIPLRFWMVVEVLVVRDKIDLPNYGEFDEKRVFTEGAMPGPVNFRGVRLGVPICEEIWNDLGVCETLAESGAEILLVPNGSPYYRGKIDVRYQVVLRQVIETGLPMIFCQSGVWPG